jgi:histidine ammonia-lyase
MNLVITVDGENLTINDVVRVARDGEEVAIGKTAVQKITRSRDVVERAVSHDKVVYGVNTGFGELANVRIGAKDLERLQTNLIRSHSAGVGQPFDKEIVRAMMLLRANALSKGFSGIRLVVIETLIELLNEGVIPVVPQQGSVGASGDLAPLAHMALVLMGEGETISRGERVSGSETLRQADIKPVRLQAKEGVALINGTQPMSAVGALAVYDALRLIEDATIAAAMSLEALRGTRSAYDERIHATRPHRGQIDVAAALRKLLPPSEISKSHINCEKVQDAYSLRCAPQVIGASLDTIRYVKRLLEVEINSATDNPLVFPEDDEIISGGNFHGQPVAVAMDFLGIALAEIASIAERRVNRLVDPKLSGLPSFLTEEGGLESGMMLAQYTAAALVSENKILAHPASVDSIPTSADQEDHVSMGTIAARKCRSILENVRNVVAIEYMCAAQGLDLLEPLQTSEPLAGAKGIIRHHVKKLEDDRQLSPDIQTIVELIKTRQISAAVEEVAGSLYDHG